ncbi:MAG TPA: ribosome maturation factor RimM [Candidatus Cybelea sp.]|jgi:16S rRNA processing protein RimM|nr:ribosome maturation factor RimM [Candidatus Cybelea sp.]
MNPPATDEIEVGQIAGLHGVRGELKCDPTSAGRIVFSTGAALRCERQGASSEIRLASVRPHKNRLLLRLDGVDDATAAQAYAGAKLFVSRERVKLQRGEYLDRDLIGCAVVGRRGEPLGTVESVEHYPASDMLLIGGALVPMVRAIVIEIDLENHRITLDPPEGLL